MYLYLKRTLLLFILLIIVIVGWYAVTRLLSPLNRLKSYEVAIVENNTEIQNGSKLLIGSYNIAHGRGGQYGASNWQPDRSKAALTSHLDKIAAQIRLSKVDAIVLNEVDFSAAWSSHVNQAAYIAEKAGFQYVVEQRNMDVSFPFYQFRFGNAILSRYPIEEKSFVKFPYASLWENIFVGSHDGVFGVVKTSAGKVGLLAVHLEYRSEAIRVASVKLFNEKVAKYSLPIIAAGDFNSSPIHYKGAQQTINGENALSYLVGDGGFKTHAPLEVDAFLNTFPTENPNATIDWILGAGQLNMLSLDVVQSQLSDHFMLVSSVEINAS